MLGMLQAVASKPKKTILVKVSSSDALPKQADLATKQDDDDNMHNGRNGRDGTVENTMNATSSGNKSFHLGGVTRTTLSPAREKGVDDTVVCVGGPGSLEVSEKATQPTHLVNMQ